MLWTYGSLGGYSEFRKLPLCLAPVNDWYKMMWTYGGLGSIMSVGYSEIVSLQLPPVNDWADQAQAWRTTAFVFNVATL